MQKVKRYRTPQVRGMILWGYNIVAAEVQVIGPIRGSVDQHYRQHGENIFMQWEFDLLCRGGLIVIKSQPLDSWTGQQSKDYQKEYEQFVQYFRVLNSRQ